MRRISIQYQHGLEQLQSLPQGIVVEVLPGFNDRPDDFIDTAAVMHCVDLVLTMDSAPAHLAGALGVPIKRFRPLSPRHCWGSPPNR